MQNNPEAVAHITDAAFADPHRQCPSIFDLKGLKEEFTERPPRSRPLLDVLLCAFPTPCCLIRRTAIERAGYSNTSLRILGDPDLLARVALEGPFMVNCNVGTIVRRSPGGALQLSDLYDSARPENCRNWSLTFRPRPSNSGERIRKSSRRARSTKMEFDQPSMQVVGCAIERHIRCRKSKRQGRALHLSITLCFSWRIRGGLSTFGPLRLALATCPAG